MNIIRLIFQEVVGLFVDDEMLAVSILTVVGGCWLLAHFLHGSSLAIGALLVVGCVGVLLVSVLKGARR